MDDDVISIPSSPDSAHRKVVSLPSRRRPIAKKKARAAVAAPPPARAPVPGPSILRAAATEDVIEIDDSDEEIPPAPVPRRKDKGKGKENGPRLPLFLPDDSDDNACAAGDTRERSPFAEGPLVDVPEQLASHRRLPSRAGVFTPADLPAIHDVSRPNPPILAPPAPGSRTPGTHSPDPPASSSAALPSIATRLQERAPAEAATDLVAEPTGELARARSGAPAPASPPHAGPVPASPPRAELLRAPGSPHDNAAPAHTSPERAGIVPAPAAEPAPGPSAPVDPQTVLLAHVLEIVPDVLPDHASTLLASFLEAEHQPEHALQLTLHALFESKGAYPKVERATPGKRKRDETDAGDAARPVPPAAPAAVEAVDYANLRRPPGGMAYVALTLQHLLADFPHLPAAAVRAAIRMHGGLYAPAHLALRGDLRTVADVGRRARKDKGKGRARALRDAGFDAERAWLLRELARRGVAGAAGGVQDAPDAQAPPHPAAGPSKPAAPGASIDVDEPELECGCCFGSYPFVEMVQCADAHLFCSGCIRAYAGTKLGEQSCALVCMDTAGCSAAFAESELHRVLDASLLGLYERLRARDALKGAALEDLAECPFCDFACVMEDEADRLLRCQNEACSVVSCRLCKKPDHTPKSCKEVDDDKRLGAQHTVEEAMTAALMRNCPKCKQAFVKEVGCNKMTCPHCRTLSCYVCRQIIRGYDHFNEAPPYNRVRAADKCPLWDDHDQRHAAEVVAARDRAVAEFKQANPDADPSEINVDAPAAGPARAAHGPGMGLGMVIGIGMGAGLGIRGFAGIGGIGGGMGAGIGGIALPAAAPEPAAPFYARMHRRIDALHADLARVEARAAPAPAPAPPVVVPPPPLPRRKSPTAVQRRRIRALAQGERVVLAPPPPLPAAPAPVLAPPARGRKRARVASPPPAARARPYDFDRAAFEPLAPLARAAAPPPPPAPPLFPAPLDPFHGVWAPGPAPAGVPRYDEPGGGMGRAAREAALRRMFDQEQAHLQRAGELQERLRRRA